MFSVNVSARPISVVADGPFLADSLNPLCVILYNSITIGKKNHEKLFRDGLYNCIG